MGQSCARGHGTKQQPSSSSRGYGNNWRKKVRGPYLAANPRCVGVLGQHHPNCDGRATIPDHYPKTRAELVRMGVPDPDAWHRLQPLSDSCHKWKTARFDGAWGNPKRSVGR